MAPAPSPEAVLDDVRLMLLDVLGEEELLVDVELDTSFTDDLELESIEFVALAERVERRYGDKVDFIGWMAGMELDEIIALTVGDLVAVVVAAHA